jgi:hypothetical protein
MSKRVLRSKTMDKMSEEMDLGSREKSPESIELTPAIEIEEGRLSNVSEVNQEIVVSETPSDIEMVEKDIERSKSPSNFDMQTMISMMQQLSQQFQQSKVEAKQDLGKVIQELKEGQKQDLGKVVQELTENQKQLEERLRENSRQDLVKATQELREGQEKMLLECQNSREQLKKELSERVATVTVEIGQVKQDLKKWQGRVEREMIGVKQQFEREREQQDAKLEQLAEHQEAENAKIKQKIGEIQEIVETHKAETNREITAVKVTVDVIQKELQGNIDTVSRRIWENQGKLEERAKDDKVVLQEELKSLEQKVVQLEVKTRNQMQIPGHRGEEIVEASVVGSDRSANIQTPDPRSGSNNAESVKFIANLGSTEFALPSFDESKGMNPVAHIRQLEEFFQFRGIPQRLWLIVAKKSVVGSVSKQWLEATNTKFINYEQFKSEFLSTWWSAAQQGLVKCKLYQSKYDKSAGLSLSAHFLKYATMASYLEPKLNDSEVIEALRCHYPPEIQKLLVSTKLNTVAEVLEVLKRLELMEERNLAFDTSPRSNSGQQRNQQNRNGDPRYEGANNVRQVRRYIPRDTENWRSNRGQNSYRGRNYNNERERQEEVRNHEQNRNRDREGNAREERTRVTEEN